MDIFDIRRALNQAKRDIQAGESAAKETAQMLIGRCRSITQDDLYSSHEIIVKLKRELSQYDAKKRCWKN